MCPGGSGRGARYPDSRGAEVIFRLLGILESRISVPHLPLAPEFLSAVNR
jgi:hypothetical protein